MLFKIWISKNPWLKFVAYKRSLAGWARESNRKHQPTRTAPCGGRAAPLPPLLSSQSLPILPRRCRRAAPALGRVALVAADLLVLLSRRWMGGALRLREVQLGGTRFGTVAGISSVAAGSWQGRALAGRRRQGLFGRDLGQQVLSRWWRNPKVELVCRCALGVGDLGRWNLNWVGPVRSPYFFCPSLSFLFLFYFT
jgi:hypothetical protein